MSDLRSVLNEIYVERQRQDAKWGEQNHCPSDWLMILGEEVGEANKHALEARFAHLKHHPNKEEVSLEYYRQELVQIASVAVAMIQSFDRNKK